MQFTTVLLFLAPLLAAASPVEREAEPIKACCYRSDDVNRLLFKTTEMSQEVLDTLNWCYLQVDRDESDPNNCSKAKRQFTSGYCPENLGTVVSECS
ncbi:hypothetical protein CPLU01_11961 [Colletotrichum plurivorum]|uniref:Uncharacterized protein n=1 Tax=Colletotrichum plurivorum TaxID=2175906 RepID=A0A8H6K0I2_9PEZI|nr:hypothetical protein CPLU01_11961 [Colletotrichum plurivorum]